MENEFRREVFVLKPTSKEEKEKAKLRVAAYCRVSTDSEDQVHSFIAQVAKHISVFTALWRSRKVRTSVQTLNGAYPNGWRMVHTALI